MFFDKPFMQPVRKDAFAHVEYSIEVFANAEETITLCQEVNFGMAGEHRVALIDPSELDGVTQALQQIRVAVDDPDKQPREIRLKDVEIYVSDSGCVCVLPVNEENQEDEAPIIIETYRVPALIEALEKARADLS